MEQDRVLRDTLRPRVREGQIQLELKHITPEDFRDCDRVYIVACGSASHVGHVARTYIEKLTRVPVCVELASEFRYIDPIITPHTITIVISQSGETLDTLFALREAKSRGSKVLSIVNVVGSSIANESQDVIYTWAGPEIAVATTKAYSAQLAVCYLVALYMAQCKGALSPQALADAIAALNALPELATHMLQSQDQLKYLASLYFGCKDIFFIGRNVDWAIALEGSLKLKEISYIHSEAYAAGELKHGTISLVEPGTLVVALCTYGPLRENDGQQHPGGQSPGGHRAGPGGGRPAPGGRGGGPCGLAAQGRPPAGAFPGGDPATAVRLLCGPAQGLRHR